MRVDDLVQAFQDDLEPRRELARPGLHAAARDIAQLRSLVLDDAEAGDAQARIDAENLQSSTAVV
jgi:hypothetical protein